MKKQEKAPEKKPLALNRATVKQLSEDRLAEANGGGICRPERTCTITF